MLLIFSLLLGAAFINAHPSSNPVSRAVVGDNKPWDYLLFVQRWPQSVCNSMGRGQCEIPSIISDWVVHGLWPNYNDGKWPSFCDKDDKFDVSKVEQFRARLEQTWPNLESGKTEEGLWAHEWEKHGTCAKTLPALADEEKYFSQSLDLMNNFHIGKALAKNNIVPSNTKSYTKADIEQALRDNIGNGSDLIELACIRGNLPNAVVELDGQLRRKGKAQLVEARACVDKQLNIMSCPHAEGAAQVDTVGQRAKRAIYNVLSWFTTSNLPITANRPVASSAGDDACPSDEIYIPVFSK